MFIDPRKPLETCDFKDCDVCTVRSAVHCHFHAPDLMRFFAMFLPAAILGVIGVVRTGWLHLLPMAGIFIGYFGFLEIRVMCSHCPHYADEGNHLRCWANYGSPKLWRYRPGPMSGWEKFWFLAGMAAVFAYPAVWMVVSSQWLVFGGYVLSVAGFFYGLRRWYCSQCINFACPFNHVPEAVRVVFRKKNPGA